MVNQKTVEYLEKEIKEAKSAHDDEYLFELKQELSLLRYYEREE